VSESKEKSLLDFGSCAGCAGKLSVDLVNQVIQGLPTFDDPNLLVGAEYCSDAGAYQIADDLAVLNTVDFFPPLVDDPYVFGKIAATNALSDVYAMGGRPLTALNIVCFPDQDLPLSMLHEILRGGGEQVKSAGAVVVGGHSLRDTEVKYGMAITGCVDPKRMMRNTQARPGDVLVLTKALGTGFVTTALKGRCCPDEVYDAAVASMTQLNRIGAEAAQAVGARAMTDVTGFGLSGHGYEIANGSGVTVHVQVSRLPKIPGTPALIEQGLFTRANKTNRAYVEDNMRIEPGVDPSALEYVFDPQTSGGLLIAVAADKCDELIHRCVDSGGAAASVIGHVEPKADASLVIEP
jgi:selenide,water dikinase